MPRRPPAASQVRYRCVVFDRGGRLSYDPAALREDDGTGTAPVVSLDVDPGDAVLPVDHPDGGVYGRIVVCGDTVEEVETQLAAVRADLALRLEPSDEQEIPR